MTEVPAFPALETERLLLREILAEDADALFAIHGNAEVMRWFGSDPLPDLPAAEALIKGFAGWRLTPNPGTRWGIQRKDGSELIGTCGLFAWNRNWRKCFVGYELAQDEQGKGYMRETLQVVLHWGYEHMALNRIEAQIHPENGASLKLAQSMGFVQEGRLREIGFWRGQYHDMLQFSLLRAEFKGLSVSA